MVILDKYHDEDESIEPSIDAPPSYETIAAAQSGQPARVLDEKKLPLPPEPILSISGSSWSSSPNARAGPSRPLSGSSANPSSSWLSMPMLTSFASSRPAKQVRQTILALVRDLVLNTESPNLLSSCADACRNYGLDLSSLLQDPSIEQHSAIYWAVLNRRDALLPSLLAHAAPLSRATVSEVRRACLATANQDLFQSLRCQREPFTKEMMPLSTSPGADALVLGCMPADEVSIRERDGPGEFVAELRLNLWQKRMRVSGRVSVEFIARGRIWSLTFFSPPSTAHATAGMWQVALCLLEHSPPTFIDSRLVIDLPLPSPSSLPANTSRSQTSNLISLSPPIDDPGRSAPVSPPPLSPSPSSRSRHKSKALQTIELRLKSTHRLAYRASDTFYTTLDAAFSKQKDWTPPHAEHWVDKGDNTNYTNAIVATLANGAGEELLYDNTPFITTDGTLCVRLEARLGKPETECVIC